MLPQTDAGKDAVRLRGLFGGETKERAEGWVALIEEQAAAPYRESLDSLVRAVDKGLLYDAHEQGKHLFALFDTLSDARKRSNHDHNWQTFTGPHISGEAVLCVVCGAIP